MCIRDSGPPPGSYGRAGRATTGILDGGSGFVEYERGGPSSGRPAPALPAAHCARRRHPLPVGDRAASQPIGDPRQLMTLYGRIISLSSCSMMWQCHTNSPAVSNFALMRVISPGYATTVSL